LLSADVILAELRKEAEKVNQSQVPEMMRSSSVIQKLHKDDSSTRSSGETEKRSTGPAVTATRKRMGRKQNNEHIEGVLVASPNHSVGLRVTSTLPGSASAVYRLKVKSTTEVEGKLNEKGANLILLESGVLERWMKSRNRAARLQIETAEAVEYINILCDVEAASLFKALIMPPRRQWEQVREFERFQPRPGINVYADAMMRLRLDHLYVNEFKNEDRGVAQYRCVGHTGCPRKYKVSRTGDTVKVEKCEHEGPVPIRMRDRHPAHIVDFIMREGTVSHVNASAILTNLEVYFPEYAGRITRYQVQRLLDTAPTRSGVNMPNISNYYQLDGEFAPHRLTNAMVQFIREGRDLQEEFVYHGGRWGESHWAVVYGGAKVAGMLSSLLWYIEHMPDGFALYMDVQNKILRDGLKVAWIGSTRVWYNPLKRAYSHTFVPFLSAIIDEESADVYRFMLEKLDLLVRVLTSGDRDLRDVVNFCVHDAHQGALSACREKLPGVRNGRCYYHLSKNIKDNASKLGAACPLVERHKHWLHASPTDKLYGTLSEALIASVQPLSGRGAAYLRNTLNVDKYGYPNITLDDEGLGLRCTQVLNNIVETLNKTMAKIVGRKRLGISAFAALIKDVRRCS
ncbi:hypothetical protein FOZ63_027107, partial [Perkinsus olseni]